MRTRRRIRIRIRGVRSVRRDERVLSGRAGGLGVNVDAARAESSVVLGH